MSRNSGFNKAELLELERQLSRPSGEQGRVIGKQMHEQNKSMTIETILALGIQAADKILELGMGNAGHLDLLLQQAEGIQYTGLEVSLTMVKEAERTRIELLQQQQVLLELYDGENILFPPSYFDKIMTVNTIYFMASPTRLFDEVHRVLKPGGQFAITFAHKSFMKQLPFVGDRFTLYDPDEVIAIIEKSAFSMETHREREEVVRSKTGEWVTRKYSVLLLKKK